MTIEVIDKNAIIQNFKDQGIKIILVKPRSKIPDIPDFAKYLSGEKVYDSEILPTQNYGVICGKISDNLVVIDIEKIDPDDYHNKKGKPRHIPVEEDFIDKIIPNCKNETFTTKTGSGSYHILVKGETIPIKTSTFVYEKDEKNIYQIDFKVTGQCVEAGSIHENGNRYEMVSNVRTIKRTDIQFILMRLEKIGFKGVKIEDNDYNTWTLDELLQGGWVRTDRRRKQKSLYNKLRRNGKSIPETKQIIIEINMKLSQPLEEVEFNQNFDEAEDFFQTKVLPKYGYVEETLSPHDFKVKIEDVEKYLNTQVKNDPILVKQLLRAYLSAYTNNPINIGVLAPSSEGKTYSTVQVSDIFPGEDIVLIGRMSPTVLIHQQGVLVNENNESIENEVKELDDEILAAKKEKRKEDVDKLKQDKRELTKNARNLVDLKNKIMIFLDNPDPQVYEMLKPIMSHDKKEILYKTTTGDGSLRVRETLIRNWPVFIFCSAKNEAQNEVWREIETRVFMVSPDTSIEKYKEANKLTSQKFGLPSFASGLYDNADNKNKSIQGIRRFKEILSELCKDNENPIFNPFREQIADAFPSNQGVTMRHFTRLMSFCNIETLINYERNIKLHFETFEGIKKPCIITPLRDIDNAIKVLGKISTIPPDKLKFYYDIFIPTATKETLDHSATSAQLAGKYHEVFKKPITSKQVLENYLTPLTSHGILEYESVQGDKYNHYKSAGTITIENLDELTHSILGKSNEIEQPNEISRHKEKLISCLKAFKTHSTGLGKSYGYFIDENIYLSNSQIVSNEFEGF